MAPQLKTEQEMFPLVEAWLKSGLTQKQYCLDHGLPVHILVYWIGRYRNAQPHIAIADKEKTPTGKMSKKIMDAESASGFIRLSLLPPIPTPAPTTASSQLPAGNMEVVLPTGAIIGFSATVPACYLKELLSPCSH